MKKIKYILLSLVSICFLVQNAAAFDWDGVLQSETNATASDTSFSDLSLDEIGKASLTFNIPCNKEDTFFLQMTGSYTYELDGILSTSSSLSYIDVDKFILAVRESTPEYVLKADTGRFDFCDRSEVVYNSYTDGFVLSYKNNVLDSKFYIGTTALLNAKNITILKDGVAHSSTSSTLYTLTYPYITGDVYFAFDNLLWGQSFGFDFLPVIGLNTKTYPSNEESRLYLNLFFYGPIGSKFSYDLSSIVCVYDLESLKFSDFSKLVFEFSPVDSFSINSTTVYASGTNSFLSPFYGFTSTTATYASDEPEYSGLIKSGVSMTYSPSKKFSTTASYDAVMDCSTSFVYDGMQWSYDMDINLVSDLDVYLLVYQYIGADESDNNVGAQVKVKFSF